MAFAAVTRRGVQTMLRLYDSMPEADLYVPEKFAVLAGDVSGASRTVRPFSALKVVLPELFRGYRQLVLFTSLGAATRLLAPLLVDKRRDPAVVVVDEGGSYAISLLSAHLGGANDLARKVAAYLGAQPVITTASDLQGTLAIDLLGKKWGWHLELEENLTRVCAAVVNGEPVGVLQESGEKLDAFDGENLFFYASLEEAVKFFPRMCAWVIITHRLLEEEIQALQDRMIIWRPRCLVLGVGCSRGASAEAIESLIRQTLAAHRLSFHSVHTLASITLKQNEPGLLQVAERFGWRLQFYEATALNRVPVAHPSDVVYRVTGAYAVSQPAAVLAAGGGPLLVEKVKNDQVTLSVALRT